MYLNNVHGPYPPQEVATNAVKHLHSCCLNILCFCKARAILVVWQIVEVPDPDHEFYRWNSPKMRLFIEMAGASGWSCTSIGVMHSTCQQHQGKVAVLLGDKCKEYKDFIDTVILWHLWVT